jgi:hypothetical protein
VSGYHTKYERTHVKRAPPWGLAPSQPTEATTRMLAAAQATARAYIAGRDALVSGAMPGEFDAKELRYV